MASVIVPSWSVRRTFAGKPVASLPEPARSDQLSGGRDGDAFEIRRQQAAATVGKQKVGARPAHPRRGDRLGVEVEVAEIAQSGAVGRHHAQGHIGGAGQVSRSTVLGREDLKLEARHGHDPAGSQPLDRGAARRGLEGGGAPGGACQVGVRNQHGARGAVEPGQASHMAERRSA